MFPGPVVVPLGFEPRLTEPKSAVLPLHNGTIVIARRQPPCDIDGANVEVFFISAKGNGENFE